MKISTPPSAMRLDDLIRHLPGAVVDGRRDLLVRDLACDPRRARPDSLYIALPAAPGPDMASPADPSDLALALERGATAFITDHPQARAGRATRIHVPDAHQALAQAANSFYARPSSQLTVLGVHGAAGTAEISFHLKSMLETAGRVTGWIGADRHEIGDRVLPMLHTPSNLLDIQQSLAAMVRAGCSVCVIEMTSPSDECRPWLGVDFDAVFSTEPGPAASPRAVQPRTFGRSPELPFQFKERDKNKAAVTNIGAVFGSPSPGTWSPVVQLAHGTPMPHSLHASRIVLDQHGSRCVVHLPKRCFACRLSPPRFASIGHALSAAAAALQLGLSEDTVATALKNTPPVPGQLEAVRAGQPFGVYVDSARHPESLRDALEALGRVTPGRVLLLTGSPAGTTARARLDLGRAAAQLADITVLTKDNPRREDPLSIAAQIAAGHEPGRGRLEVILDRAHAIRRILHLAGPGDAVLIAGKGRAAYQEEQGAVFPFDDRFHAAQALARLGHRDSRIRCS